MFLHITYGVYTSVSFLGHFTDAAYTPEGVAADRYVCPRTERGWPPLAYNEHRFQQNTPITNFQACNHEECLRNLI